MRILSLSSLVLTAMSCAGPTPWSACPDAPCRAQAAEAAWRESPDQVLLFLRDRAGPIEQAVLVELLATASPEDQDRLCATAPQDSPAARRCARLTLWPHLSQSPTTTRGRDATRRGPGPPSGKPPSPGLGMASQPDAEVRGSCGADTTCLADLAETHAGRGQPLLGAAACQEAWPAGTAVQAECLLRVARRASWDLGIAAVHETLAICGQAGRLEENCLHRVLVEAMPVATPADRPDIDTVAAAVRSAKRVRGLVSEPVGALYADYMWSEWLVACVALAEGLTGHLAPLLPPEAQPHLRSAAAWWAVSHQGLDGGIDALAQGLLEALDRRPTPGWTSPMGLARDYTSLNAAAGLRTRWSLDLGHEDTLQAHFFLASGRRAGAEDPAEDARIALLEAAHRLVPDLDPAVLLPYLDLAQPVILRWTAARIHQERWPASMPIALQSDPSPLVRGRSYRR